MHSLIPPQYAEEYAYMGERAYLNCARMGMPPERSRKVARRFTDAFSASFGSDGECSAERIRALAKERAAKLINASKEDVFLTVNTTQGNNILPYGYPFEAGDEVIIGNGDFPNVWIPWAGLQSRGVKVVTVDCHNGIVPSSAFIDAMTPRTKAVGISWVQSSSGYTADMYMLGRECRRRGILLSVDAIQGMGRLPMDVTGMQIDLLSSASYKGLLGTMGAAFCYCREEVMERIDPHLVSGNIVYEGMPLGGGFLSAPQPALASRAARFEAGTMNVAGCAVMAESMGLLLEIGVDNIASHIRGLETRLRGMIASSRLDIAILGSSDPATWSGTVTIVFPKEKRAALDAALVKREVYASLGEGTLRASFHFYNTEEHAERLMAALYEALTE